MKKFLFFAIMAGAVMVANAQSLSFKYENTTYGANDTITVQSTSGSFEFYPIIHFEASSGIIAKLMSEKLNNSSISIFQTCTGLSCKVGSESAPFSLAANADYTELHIVYEIPDDATDALFRMVVWDTAAPDVEGSVFVKVKAPTAGINDDFPMHGSTANSLGMAYPNPTNSMVNIPYNNADDNAVLRIVDQKGATVRRIALSKGHGTVAINLSDLPKGVYLYSLENRPTQESRKIILK